MRIRLVEVPWTIRAVATLLTFARRIGLQLTQDAVCVKLMMANFHLDDVGSRAAETDCAFCI